MGFNNDIYTAQGKSSMKTNHTFFISVAGTILPDNKLSGISGINTLKILREDPEMEYISIVTLSVNAICDIEQEFAVGFFRYLTKSIKTNEFMAALDEAMKFLEYALINEFVDDWIDTTVTGQLP
jgi:CheY-like chemotaxis protein